MTLDAIKAAIEQLPEADQQQLLTWLDEREQLAWDAEMQRDFAPGGQGSSLIDKVKADIRGGKFKRIDQRSS